MSDIHLKHPLVKHKHKGEATLSMTIKDVKMHSCDRWSQDSGVYACWSMSNLLRSMPYFSLHLKLTSTRAALTYWFLIWSYSSSTHSLDSQPFSSVLFHLYLFVPLQTMANRIFLMLCVLSCAQIQDSPIPGAIWWWQYACHVSESNSCDSSLFTKSRRALRLEMEQK